jgi:hypothetical protein
MLVNPSALFVLVSVLWMGCQGDAKAPKRRTGPVAILTGKIKLAEGAQLPAYTTLDFVRRPLHVHAQPAPPAGCASANEEARTAVRLNPDRSLAGVVIAASDFTRVRERAPEKHRVVIENCRLKPSIIAATGGDEISIENRDAYGFEPLVGPAYVGAALEQGETLRFPLAPGGVDSILCSLGAPCGRTDMVVFFHPIHAVSKPDGTFRIDNFPASELVRVIAWHPLFEEKESFVWLEPGETTAIELELTPKSRFVEATPAGHVSTASGSP